jgi:hypothetical protein
MRSKPRPPPPVAWDTAATRGPSTAAAPGAASSASTSTSQQRLIQTVLAIIAVFTIAHLGVALHSVRHTQQPTSASGGANIKTSAVTGGSKPVANAPLSTSTASNAKAMICLHNVSLERGLAISEQGGGHGAAPHTSFIMFTLVGKDVTQADSEEGWCDPYFTQWAFAKAIANAFKFAGRHAAVETLFVSVVVLDSSDTDARVCSSGVPLHVFLSAQLWELLERPFWPRVALALMSHQYSAASVHLLRIPVGQTACADQSVRIPLGQQAQRHDRNTWFSSEDVLQRLRHAVWDNHATTGGDHEINNANSTAIRWGSGARITQIAWRRSRQSFFKRGPLNVLMLLPSEASALSSPRYETRALVQHFADSAKWLQSKFDPVSFAAVRAVSVSSTDSNAWKLVASRLHDVDVLVVPAGSLLGALAAVSLAPGAAIVEVATQDYRPLSARPLYRLATLRASVVLLEPGSVASLSSPNASSCGGRQPATRLLDGVAIGRRCAAAATATAKPKRAAGGLDERSSSQGRWYHGVKSAAASVWLWRSRFLDIHAFDTRR